VSATDRRSFLRMGVGLTALTAGARGAEAACTPCPESSPLMTQQGYEACAFEHDGLSHCVYRSGGPGPGVLVMHELPGMTPEFLALASRIRARGYTVYLPLFFGEPGETRTDVGRVASVCLSREFTCLASHGSGRITPWLRALCLQIQLERGGAVGAIGLCLTGGLVLSLMVDDPVQAPITSEPAVPLFGLGEGWKRSFGISEDDYEAARERSKTVPLLAFRFTGDRLCPKERFDRLREEFGDFRCLEIDSGEHNAHGIPSDAHAVLTKHFVDRPGHPTVRALEMTLDFLDERLKRKPRGAAIRPA